MSKERSVFHFSVDNVENPFQLMCRQNLALFIKASIIMHIMIFEERRNGYVIEFFDIAKEAVHNGFIIDDFDHEKTFTWNKREILQSSTSNFISDERWAA